ncbi:MAG: alpha/beta fold hydrolase [Acidimicrobiales bacterium]
MPAGPAVPVVLVPGLLVTARLYAPQLPALWHHGPVTVADHTRDDSMPAIARRILSDAPPRFALAGLSMGGYVALEMVRQAPERIVGLALLDTSARPDTDEQRARRTHQIDLARAGRLDEVVDQQYPLLVHRDRLEDAAMRALVRLMAEETGVAAFAREQRAIMTRADSRPNLQAIRCPTLVVVGDGDELTPPELSGELTAGIPGARLEIVTGAGHLSTLEEPERVTAALVDWLSALAPA